ncbi:Histidine phosphatase superfamily (branch 2), putative [Angomonas deanei]|uniref:Histidine phosphatase superfamily (Branch 2), putative n=1 Tax=Angomonas deanei TaxID=59799 RepID=A0A7G2C3W2_9TRYP|nr:Histidine phosphatase superfamily (branch 2), putative [Angomonas deanei]
MQLFLFLVSVCLLCLTHVCAERDYVLELAQAVHRHGARSPVVDHNITEICGFEFPCGFLNREGQQQTVQVGHFLRHRYTADETVVDPTHPFLPDELYNLTVAYSRSSNVPRTLQSAEGVLRGLFPNMTHYYPAILAETTTTDLLLRADNLAAIYADTNFAKEELKEVCNPVADAEFPDGTLLNQIAAEVHSDEFCSNPKKRVSCAKKLCDIGRCYQTTGRLAEDGYPLLREHLPELCTVAACVNRFKSSFNASNPVHVLQGSRGQVLVQEILHNARQKMKGKNTYKFMDYSTHDSTLRPLAGTLGDNSDLAMMPTFATTYVFELLRRATAAEGSTEVGDYAMRVKRGHPGVTPDTNFEFAWDDFELRCMRAAGDVYVAEGNVCPLEDFIRFIDSSKPTNAAGLCYVDPVLLARMKCPADAEETKEVLNSDCKLYRQQCPSYACGDGYRLDGVDYGCYKSTKSASPGRGVGSLVFFFFLGAALTIACLYVIKRLYKRSTQNRYETVATLEESEVAAVV